MSVFNDERAVFTGRYDNLNSASALQVPAAVILGNGTVSTDTDGFLTGSRPFRITDMLVTFRDVTYTDPNEDWHLGWEIKYSTDGGAAYTVAQARTANVDLPMVWDDSVGATGTDFTIDTPLSLFSYIGKGLDTKQSAALTERTQAPVRIPARAYVRVSLGLYVAGTLTAASAADLDSVELTVFGKPV